MAQESRTRESDDDPPEGVRRWLVSCDESGVHGSPCYGFGTLWMSWKRRGDVVAYMSHPKETAKLIEEAATSAHVNR